MKKKIMDLIDQSNSDYWDESETTYTELSEKDMELNKKSHEKLADDIINLFKGE